MAWLLEQLTDEAVKKIYGTIWADEDPSELYTARFPYKPNEEVNAHVWMVIEPELTPDGVGWNSQQIWVPPAHLQEDPGPPEFLRDVPVIDLEWSDMTKDLQDDILKLGSLL